jgi:hypothetical protein
LHQLFQRAQHSARLFVQASEIPNLTEPANDLGQRTPFAMKLTVTLFQHLTPAVSDD